MAAANNNDSKDTVSAGVNVEKIKGIFWDKGMAVLFGALMSGAIMTISNDKSIAINEAVNAEWKRTTSSNLETIMNQQKHLLRESSRNQVVLESVDKEINRLRDFHK